MAMIALLTGCKTSSFTETDYILLHDVLEQEHTMYEDSHIFIFMITGDGVVKIIDGNPIEGARKFKTQISKDKTKKIFRFCIENGLCELGTTVYRKINNVPNKPPDIHEKNPFGYCTNYYYFWQIGLEGSYNIHYDLAKEKPPQNAHKIDKFIRDFAKKLREKHKIHNEDVQVT